MNVARHLPLATGIAYLLFLAILFACTGSPSPEPAVPRKILRQPVPHVLPVPVDGVSRGDLENSFGDGRSGGRQHEGIDIFAPRNTPVRTTVDGIVVEREIKSLGGRTITVVGPGGMRHYYAHLERWARKSVGEKVKAGDVLGYVGNSGNARNSPPHLHYGVQSASGGAMNPYSLILGGRRPNDR